MNMHALPDFLHIDDPSRNLAGLAAGLVPTPQRRLYRAWDGTPIGYSNDCDPITDEPYLSGLDGGYIRAVVPDFLSENRIEWGDDFAVPLLVGSVKYFQNRKPIEAVLWALAGYMVPYGVAAVVAVQAYQASGGRVPGFQGLGGKPSSITLVGRPYMRGRQCYQDERNDDTGEITPQKISTFICDLAKKRSRRGRRAPKGVFGEIPGVKAQTVRRCYRFKQVRSQKTGKLRRVCDKYVRLPV